MMTKKGEDKRQPVTLIMKGSAWGDLGGRFTSDIKGMEA